MSRRSYPCANFAHQRVFQIDLRRPVHFSLAVFTCCRALRRPKAPTCIHSCFLLTATLVVSGFSYHEQCCRAWLSVHVTCRRVSLETTEGAGLLGWTVELTMAHLVSNTIVPSYPARSSGWGGPRAPHPHQPGFVIWPQFQVRSMSIRAPRDLLGGQGVLCVDN